MHFSGGKSIALEIFRRSPLNHLNQHEFDESFSLRCSALLPPSCQLWRLLDKISDSKSLRGGEFRERFVSEVKKFIELTLTRP
jgi:hypothetical protein